MGFSVALLALAHVLAADSRCDTLPSCGTCLANSGCGWCASSTSCMSIASDGTVEGTCSDFQGSQCVGGSRDLNTRLSFRTLPSHQAVPIARLSAAVNRGLPEPRSAPIADRRPHANSLWQASHAATTRPATRARACPFACSTMRMVDASSCARRPPRLHHMSQHSTALHHPTSPTDHLPRLAQAGERRTACGPVHGIWCKLRPMTCTAAA